jgi:hypothetical protein
MIESYIDSLLKTLRINDCFSHFSPVLSGRRGAYLGEKNATLFLSGVVFCSWSQSYDFGILNYNVSVVIG